MDYINKLPIELFIYHIFNNIDCYDVYICSFVCLKWRNMIKNNIISTSHTINPKEIYISLNNIDIPEWILKNCNFLNLYQAQKYQPLNCCDYKLPIKKSRKFIISFTGLIFKFIPVSLLKESTNYFRHSYLNNKKLTIKFYQIDQKIIKQVEQAISNTKSTCDKLSILNREVNLLFKFEGFQDKIYKMYENGKMEDKMNSEHYVIPYNEFIRIKRINNKHLFKIDTHNVQSLEHDLSHNIVQLSTYINTKIGMTKHIIINTIEMLPPITNENYKDINIKIQSIKDYIKEFYNDRYQIDYLKPDLNSSCEIIQLYNQLNHLLEQS